ncbi:MAG: hypothetical protein R3F59_17595 [Myxococcota bacterium]
MVRITPLNDPTTRNLVWVRQESHRERIVLAVNDAHPAVRRAIAQAGRARGGAAAWSCSARP